ncbi:MAG: hypothetical protein SGJ11_05480 [Phycisphaerae bacterium]|nr:hypothetical protein [Phycisphaerae bacterium]
MHSSPPQRRRGNALILVTAILVLLVIIATAFISRTQAGRNVSSAQQQATQRDTRAEAVSDDLSMMLADAIFPQPIDPDALYNTAGYRSDPNDTSIRTVTNFFARLNIEPTARLFGIDRDARDWFDFDRDGNRDEPDLLPDFAYNFAPYETRPWTNWPDFLSTVAPNATLLPRGPGEPNGSILGANNLPIGDWNPYGNPGFGDNRLLRSTEPVRIDSNNDGIPDSFSHWAHLSWLAASNNGFRVAKDISDILPNTLFVTDESIGNPMALGMPYEQWLPNFPPNGVSNAEEFRTRRDAWFAAPNAGSSYLTNYATNNCLPNFFRLADLPFDLRYAVSSTFADTDGDGFTDAFWFLAPQTVERSLRYLVAVSVVDNSSLVNLNVASRFNQRNTVGYNPSDVALVGISNTTGLQVGFFDNPANNYDSINAGIPTLFLPADMSGPNPLYAPVVIGWSQDRFGDFNTDSLTFLQAIGMKDAIGAADPNNFIADFSYPAAEQAEFYSAIERQRYFKSGALRRDLPASALTPFGIGEELELRAYHGQNTPWVLSRLERALNTQDNVFSFLRSNPQRAETNEGLQQLSARALLLDNRRKITTISGARNDLLPAWLWPSPYPDPRIDYNRDGLTADTDGDITTIENPVAGELDYAAYVRQTKRIDLRRAMDVPLAGSLSAITAAVIETNRREWRADLQNLLERSLTRSWPLSGGGTAYQSYLALAGNQAIAYQRAQYDKTRQMAASMTANIDQWRDEPLQLASGLPHIDTPLHPALGVQDPIEPDWRYIGQEKHPFIMEVFFALVYPKSAIDPAMVGVVPGITGPYDVPQIFLGGGEHFVDSSSKPGAVVAVQVANPHSTPISLFGFRIKVFGRTFAFPPTTTLGAATELGPTTAIVYAIQESNIETPPGTFNQTATWLDFLDIEKTEVFSPDAEPIQQTQLFNASSAWLSTPIPSPADNPVGDFNDPNGESVELVWRILPQAGLGATLPADVVVDRFDNRVSGVPSNEFAESVSRLFTDAQHFPPKKGFEYLPGNPPARNFMDGIRIGTDDYFVAWCRASRAWTWDTWPTGNTTGDGIVRVNESNPRYVFSLPGAPVLPKQTVDGSASNGGSVTFKGDTYAFGQDPDGPDLWINYSYRSIFGEERRGKPTFFPCAVRQQAGIADNVYGMGFPYADANGNFPAGVVIGDKGWQQNDWVKAKDFTAFRAPLQMLHKDADFTQIGELLNVFCWGPVIDISTGFSDPTTEKTFGEIMLQEEDATDQPAGRGAFVNRLRITPFLDPSISPGNESGPTDGPTSVLGTPPSAPYVPALPAGVAIFDAVVCDDRGAKRLDIDGDGTISVFELDEAELRRPRNAAGYAGAMTPGLVNLNTALPESMRTLPHMTRLASNDTDFGSSTVMAPQVPIPFDINPFTRIVDSFMRYRDRTTLRVSGMIDPFVAPQDTLPHYVDRGLVQDDIASTPGFLGPIIQGSTVMAQGMRGDRGIVSIGELLLLQRTMNETAAPIEDWKVKNSFSMEFAGLDPYRTSTTTLGNSQYEYHNGMAYRIATDVNNGRNTVNPNPTVGGLTIPDRVAGDVEERNLLFSGISNLVTTRSDVFTVYFRLKAVRQDPVSGRWDATNPEFIADDSRYVMIVDRSNVQKPGDRPRILALRKVDSPN